LHVPGNGKKEAGNYKNPVITVPEGVEGLVGKEIW
jgi:hypothetical protein